jgi:hypothetical protein
MMGMYVSGTGKRLKLPDGTAEVILSGGR